LKKETKIDKAWRITLLTTLFFAVTSFGITTVASGARLKKANKNWQQKNHKITQQTKEMKKAQTKLRVDLAKKKNAEAFRNGLLQSCMFECDGDWGCERLCKYKFSHK
jgi:cell division protein FtsL